MESIVRADCKDFVPKVIDLLSTMYCLPGGPSEGHCSTGKLQVFNKDGEYGIKLGRVLGFSDVFGYSLVHQNWKFVFELFAEVTQGF